MTGLLEDLSRAIAPSGCENDARDIYLEFLRTTCLVNEKDIYIDNIGNTIVNFGNPTGPKVMIAAHIDEVGYMISYIDDDGYLFFQNIGGMDKHLTPGRAVQIKTDKGFVRGIIGRKAIHIIESDERTKVRKTKENYIDIGVKDKEEAEKLVKIGDVATVIGEFDNIGDNKDIVSGKAFDDRAGVTALGYVIKELYKDKNLKYNIYGIATVQEEVGLKGAMVAAKQLNPDIGIVLEVGFASDFPDAEKTYGMVKLGEGPVVNYGCSMDRELTDKLINVAKINDIKYQLCGDPYADGIDAYSIQTRAGAKCLSIDIPLRYMHTPYEVLDLADLENTVNLTCAFLRSE